MAKRGVLGHLCPTCHAPVPLWTVHDCTETERTVRREKALPEPPAGLWRRTPRRLLRASVVLLALWAGVAGAGQGASSGTAVIFIKGPSLVCADGLCEVHRLPFDSLPIGATTSPTCIVTDERTRAAKVVPCEPLWKWADRASGLCLKEPPYWKPYATVAEWVPCPAPTVKTAAPTCDHIELLAASREWAKSSAPDPHRGLCWLVSQRPAPPHPYMTVRERDQWGLYV